MSWTLPSDERDFLEVYVEANHKNCMNCCSLPELRLGARNDL